MSWKTLPASYDGCLPNDHLTVLGGYQRQFGGVTQRIERVKIFDTLKEARARAELRGTFRSRNLLRTAGLA